MGKGTTLSREERGFVRQALSKGFEVFAKSKVQDHMPVSAAFALKLDCNASVASMLQIFHLYFCNFLYSCPAILEKTDNHIVTIRCCVLEQLPQIFVR